MQQGVFRATALALTGWAALSCTKPIAPTRAPTTVRVSSSASSALLVEALSMLPDVTVQSVPASGSPSVIEALREEKLDIGVATADVAYLAFAGQLHQSASPFDQLRGITVLGLNTLHLIVGKDTRAKSVGDLRGLRIAFSSGTGTDLVARLLLDASGLRPDEIHLDPLAYPEPATVHVIRGDADAAFLTIVPPGNTAVAATQAGARVLEIEGAAVERLRLQHPFLVNTIIPRGTYPGQDRPIRTIGVDLLLVCRADLDAGLVRRLMDAYFAVIARAAPAVDFDRAPAMSIPLHPAAAQYYRQRELSR
jgi:TRAP transporter TAXI family solute receptor